MNQDHQTYRLYALSYCFVLFLLNACAPIPYVSPPLKTSLGFSSARGTRTHLETQSQEEMGGQFLLSTHLSLHPFSLANRLDRSYDFGLGYFMSDLNANEEYAFLSGPFLQGQYFIDVIPVNQSVFRWGLIGRGGLVFSNQDAHTLGWTTSMGLAMEYVSWYEVSPFTTIDSEISGEDQSDQTHIIGLAHGEGAFGLELLGSIIQGHTDEYWTLTVGLVLEFPTSAGIVLVPLFPNEDPEDSTTDPSW